MLRTIFSAILLFAVPAATAAEAPSSGSQIQQIPTLPAPVSPAPEIRIDRNDRPAPAASDQTRIRVLGLRIENASRFSETELIAASGFVPDTDLSLDELRALAANIAEHYHRSGFFLAQAFLPAQQVRDGIITIAVLEGRYGEVTLSNASRLSDSLARRLLAGLEPGDTVAIAPLEERLLRLSDLPGVEVRSTLAPGRSVGASDLIVELTPSRRFSGSVDLDNAGNRYTGAERLGATLDLNNPAGLGDVATLRLLTSTRGLDYARLAYQAQLGGSRAGLAYASMDYALGEEFEALEAKGTARIASLFVAHAPIRSRTANLRLQLAYDAKDFTDRVDSTATSSDKRAGVWMASLLGDRRGRHGLGHYSLTWSAGEIELQDPIERAIDAATARTQGHYQKLGIELGWQQSLGAVSSLHLAFNGQIPDGNLDASEKMSLGGAGAVRAYPAGEANGDRGYVLNLELRRRAAPGSLGLPGQFQWLGFVDTGSVVLDKDPWAPGRNSRTLNGLGLGLIWADAGRFVLQTHYAHKLGSAEATSAPDAPGRWWLQAVSYF